MYPAATFIPPPHEYKRGCNGVLSNHDLSLGLRLRSTIVVKPNARYARGTCARYAGNQKLSAPVHSPGMRIEKQVGADFRDSAIAENHIRMIQRSRAFRRNQRDILDD